MIAACFSYTAQSLYNSHMSLKRRIWLFLFILLSLSSLSPHQGNAQSSPSITILAPGEGSEVTAPISIAAQISPGADNLVRVTLIDQQNNLLARKLLRVPALPEEAPLQFATNLKFEIPRESTAALLTIAIQDEHHRLQSLRSVHLVLKSTGQDYVQSPGDSVNWLTITQPLPGASISGGQFTVSGWITSPNGNPVMFDLMTDNGSIIGTSQLSVQTPGETLEFALTLSYDFINIERKVRLIVRQRSMDFASDAILDSLPIVITP